jgi:Glycosyl transferase 4-like domain
VNRESNTQSKGLNPSEPPLPSRASRPWRVLHTCDSISEIADIVSGELSVGMRPSVVTPEGFVISADAFRAKDETEVERISLINAWNDVRHWRKVILDADPGGDFDLLHAHSFAAGMAGVRNYPATVYEIDQFIEDSASGVASREPSNATEHGSWLSRSFRVAEQFVLSRAAAVVVRTESIRQAVIRRGAAAENVFAVPASLTEDAIPASRVDEEWLQGFGIDKWHRVLIYAPGWKLELGADGKLTDASRGLLEAFAMAAAEEDGAYLLAEFEEKAERAVREFAEQLQIATRVKMIPDPDRPRAFDAAHVIVADSHPSILCTPAASETSRKALLGCKALLAADLPCNRDISPSGRGCLWYRSGDYKDIAHRLAFLARNHDFRTSLADSGQRHLLETCDPIAVAMEYDRIYQRAAARRKSGGLQTPAIQLTPASALL